MNIYHLWFGYVDLVMGACFAQVGHHVIRVDNNEPKVADADFGLVKELMHSSRIFDRNQLDREMLVGMDFDYYGIGR